MNEFDVIIGSQVIVIAGLVWSNWSMFRAWRALREATKLIQAYRREVAWLTSRVDVMEGRVEAVKRAKP